MDPVISRVLELRDTSAASALRRGDRSSTQHYAYPHLSRWWDDRPYLKTPLLRFGALAAMARRVPHREGVDLATHLRTLVDRPGGMSQAGVERRLLATANGDLDKLHQRMRSLITSPVSSAIGLDYQQLWDIYRLWDHPDREVRARVRDRLLERFYTARSAEASDATPSDDADKD